MAKKKLNIAEYCLTQNNQQRGEKTALIIIDSLNAARKYTYHELHHQVCSLAAGLKTLNLPRFSVVAIQARDSEDLILSFLATLAADLIPVMLLLSLAAEGVRYIIEDTKAKLFLKLHDQSLTDGIPKDCHLLSRDQFVTLKKTVSERIISTSTENDPAFLFYTSGSTGNPKGVLHAHRAIIGRKPSLAYWLDLNDQDIVMQTDNLCWTYSLFSGLLDPLSVGATAVVYNPSHASAIAENKTSGNEWLKLINNYAVSVLASTPDIYHTILDDLNNKKERMPSLRLAGSAGALLAEEIQKTWKKQFGIPIYIALGMTEISTFISTGKLIPPRAQRIGKIQPGRHVTLLPIAGGFDVVPIGQEGMLAVHRDELGFMLGYWHESQYADCYRGDWFLTQDILVRDHDQYLTYIGRVDSIVKVEGGFRVSPIQVENVIKSCQGVKDAACAAVFDSNSKIHRLIAFVISDNTQPAMKKKILDYLSIHISDYKMPHDIIFVKKLPYNARGKIMRDRLSLAKKFTDCPPKMR